MDRARDLCVSGVLPVQFFSSSLDRWLHIRDCGIEPYEARQSAGAQVRAIQIAISLVQAVLYLTFAFNRDVLTNETQFETFFSAVKQVYDLGGQYVGVVTTGAPSGSTATDIPDNAVNPAWRTTDLHLLTFRFWDANTTFDEYASYGDAFTNELMPILRNATLGSGSYDSEGDVNEPDFKQSFYGLETYDRLLEIKEKYDPESLFYANKGVGSDAWYVTDQLTGLPTQNGRLCRVST